MSNVLLNNKKTHTNNFMLQTMSKVNFIEKMGVTS